MKDYQCRNKQPKIVRDINLMAQLTQLQTDMTPASGRILSGPSANAPGHGIVFMQDPSAREKVDQ
jgi:hypothetical protein